MLWIGPDAGIGGWAGIALLVVNILILILATTIIPRNRRPTTALAWLLTIFLIPYLGFALFLLFGTNRLSIKRRRMQQQVDGIIRQATRSIPEHMELADAPGWFAEVANLGRQLTAIPLVDGNRLALSGNYDRSLEQLAEAIDAAEQRVHILYYTLATDATTEPVLAAIERATARGVTVRILFDHLGSLKYSGYPKLRRRLRAAGCEVRAMLPIWPWQGGFQRLDLRNHRKLVVIDDETAFMGSQNLIDRRYHKRAKGDAERLWKDLVVRVEGPMVAAINAVFISDWFAETGELLASPDELIPLPSRREFDDDREASSYPCQLIPSGPGYEHENNLRLFNQLIYSAQSNLTIVSPYFVPDDSMLYAVTTAAQRGVDVTLYVSEVGDQFFAFHAQRSYYDTLMEAGVRIRLYRKPYILHSKHITVDDCVSLIGSSNMDMRSFTLNAELMLMVFSEEFVERMREIENGYRQRSIELTRETWRQRPILTRAFDNIARLTSALQ